MPVLSVSLKPGPSSCRAAVTNSPDILRLLGGPPVWLQQFAEAGPRSCAFPAGIADGCSLLARRLGCLIILWLLGLVTSYTIGGVIHVLLVIALVMVLVNFISGRRGAR